MVTQEQIDKVNAAIAPLYSDPAFSTVQGDFVVKFTQIPPAPVATDESIDIVRV